jgi:superfamily II DNA or RNA helicase
MSTGLIDRTILGPNTIALRPYQEEAIEAIRNRFSVGDRSTLLILPTGMGKTVTFGNVARRTVAKGGRVLILAHRGELIDQAVNTLDRIGIECGVEKADAYARASFDPSVVVATVQTMQRDRLASWAPDYFRMIITDEAHHATAKSYGSIYRHFHAARHLGVTATADRADEDNLGDVFESVAYEATLYDAMTASAPGPYLCRLKVVQCDVQIDLTDIRTTGGDFNAADLEERIAPLVEILANATRQEIGDRPTLLFTPDVGSATAFATALTSLGIQADWVSGDSADRAYKIAKFKDGETQVLCNCALLTEGFDAPRTAAIVLARPTKSRSLYAQMVGRGTRLSPGKTDCLVIDFAWLTGRHELVKPAELLCSADADAEVLGLAAEFTKANPGLDLVEAVERAEAEHKERQILRIKAREKQVKYRRVAYDPLSVCDVLGLPSRPPTNAIINKATEGQVRALEKFGVADAASMSKRRAGVMLDTLITRSKQGKATMKQVTWLIKSGVDPDVARSMSFEDASKRLDQFFSKGRSA